MIETSRKNSQVSTTNTATIPNVVKMDSAPHSRSAA
jgi:hypothetical protein